MIRLLVLVLLASGAAAPAAPAIRPGTPYGVLVAPVPHSKAETLQVFRLIAHREAKRAGLPYDLVDAVMRIESAYSPDRIGDVGEIGLMQVRPATAAMMGFRGAPDALRDPAVNIHYGATYLGQAWHLAGGDVCRTLMKYRAGHGEERMTLLSARYCARARDHLLAQGSPLAKGIKSENFVASGVVETLGDAHRVAPASKGFWATFQARIRKANARIEAKWRRARVERA